MESDTTKQVVWITGASAGIGEALAKWYSEKGWRVVLSARREETLKKVASNLANPADSMILPLDVTRFDDFPEMTSRVMAYFGRIDCCILNAGISHRSYIRDTRFEVFQRLIEVNYLGSVAHALAVLPEFRKAGRGQFVVISSLMGKFSTPVRAGYSGSKHALHGFFDGLRMEEYPDIKVTMVCPGFVQTEVTANALTADGKPQGTIDETTAKGVPVDKAAEIIGKAAENGKREIAFGGIEKTGLWIKRFFPSLLDKLVLKNRKKWEIENKSN
jgi:short-subunit dehydrogenase